MNIPINCPICNAPLLNVFKDDLYSRYVVKCCDKKLNHVFRCGIAEINEELRWVRLERAISNIAVIWYFVEPKQVAIDDGQHAYYYMPFFEPDFSDYQKLLNKLKTYILLS